MLLLATGCSIPTGSSAQPTPTESRAGTPTATATETTKNTRNTTTRKPSGGPTATTDPSGSKVVLEVNGTGTALTIDYDAGTPMREQDVPLPWRKEFTPPQGFDLLQIVVVAAPGATGCRIILDGKVVDSQPGDCLYQP